MLEEIARFLLKFALQEGLLKISEVVKAAEDEQRVRAKDQADKVSAIKDERKAGHDPAKSVSENEQDLEAALDDFVHHRLPSGLSK